MGDIQKGFILRTAGGAVSVIAMRYYWQAVTALTGKDPRTETRDAPPHTLDSISLVGKHHEDSETSTAAAGRIVYQTLAGKEPEAQETKTILSQLVHWSYGMLQGGVYGAARANAGVPDVAGGLALATGLWLFGDELAVSLLGLADGPMKFPLSQHAHRWGAHLAYGLAISTTTQVLYRVFS